MPVLTASDGAQLHWEERGSGPTVLLTPYWSMHPSVFDPIEAVLEQSFRVVRYDERGMGRSERTGPFDIATGVADLEAVCLEVGGVEAALCLLDAGNRAVRIADAQPDLLRSVVCMGSAPTGVGPLRGSESLIASEAVVNAFLQQLDADPRGAIHAALAGANTGLSEDELRERVQLQMEYADPRAAVERARAWADDDEASEPGRRIGSRLHVCLTHAMGGPDSWFPSAKELETIVRKQFPETTIHWTSDGIVSAADEIAAVMRLAASGEPAEAFPHGT